jgi:uncharacterized protein YebE (UPF0316 family)
MFDMPLFDSPVFTWAILPLMIFLARICDVSIGTVRVIFVARGFRGYAPVLAFFEVLIWLMAIGQIMKNLNNVACYVAYSMGYATGTYVGIWLEEKLSLGKVIVRVITRKDATELVQCMRASNFPVTAIDAEGETGNVKVIFTIIRRQMLPRMVAMIKQFNPNAFYSVEDVRFVSEIALPSPRPPASRVVTEAGGEH